MREILYWNREWEYVDEFFPDFKLGQKSDLISIVELPHSNASFPYNYFTESLYEKVSGYRKIFHAPLYWKDKRIFVNFEGAGHEARIFLNGKEIFCHKGGYTGFSLELTDNLLIDHENILAVKLDSKEDLNIPPFGGIIDYLTFGGLYREVNLEIRDKSFIEDIFVQTLDVTKEKKRLLLDICLVLDKEHLSNGLLGLDFELLEKKSGKLVVKFEKVLDEVLDSLNFKCEFFIDNVSLWDIDNPNLYTLVTKLNISGDNVDSYSLDFGFRSVVFKKDGFYLNDKKIKIMGLNRHQSYPHVGYAMGKSPQELDAKILKYELGVNAVRTSHYPQSKHFINACDQLGLLVFMEIPGWQHIGDEDWKDVACENVEEMVLQYRNHPSIIVWGVRINESQDDDPFYTRTNKIAHDLDPSRQTTGVRFIQKSSLLEDIYSYNDFSHIGSNAGVDPKKKVTSDMEKPYLITEYNGHMFPTKSFDWEQKRLEHALRHAKVIDGYFGYEDIAGGFGWCMFDYHTHQDFGSGDRICYHGVLDLYRNPKLAASVYASQLLKEPVLEVSSSMDIGDHPSGHIGDVYAFTNADSVKVYKNQDFVKEFFPDRLNYPSMVHPPILIDDFIGELLEVKEGLDKKAAKAIKELMRAVAKKGLANLNLSEKLKMLYFMKTRKLSFDDAYQIFSTYMGNWGDSAISYRFDAIKDGELVKSITREPVNEIKLKVNIDKKDLVEDASYDVASVRILAVDQNDNILPYYMEPFTVRVEGPIEVLGTSTFSFKGGRAGLYVRSKNKAGLAKIIVEGNDFDKVEVDFDVKVLK